MTEKLKELLQYSTKIELTDEIKNMPIEALEKYNISPIDISFLKGKSISTVGELLSYPIPESFENEYMPYKNEWFRIREQIMKNGLLFVADQIKYQENNISDEVALIPLDKLNLDARISHMILRTKTRFLGDLLMVDYDYYRNVRNAGEKSVEALKEVIHSLGYKMINEKTTLNEIRKEYQEKGIPMIQETLNLDKWTAGLLYKNGIYTISDLLNFKGDIYSLEGMTKNKKDILEKAIKNYQNSDKKVENKSDTISEQIELVKSNNKAIEERIKLKEQLLEEYNNLINEQNELLKKEQAIDEMIASKTICSESKQKVKVKTK